MKRSLAALSCTIFLLFSLTGFFASCTQDGDGPLSVMPNGESVEGSGFFLAATLDSGKLIHLVSDTLYITLSKIWSFSDCSLKSINMHYGSEDSLFVISPEVNIKVNTEDCPSPMYRPDTVFKLMLGDVIPSEITKAVVKNDADSILDSIMLRRGKFVLDTFKIYIDSSFNDVTALPLRTKDSPSILRVLDSLTPQKFYWRTLRAKCTMRVDMCDSVVADTLYPDSWNVNDTVLVPVRYSCASEDSVYCLESKWVYDSTALGKVQTRPDTIWHTSTYYVEEIPECGTMNRYTYYNFFLGGKVNFIRELLEPDESEMACGPSSKKDWVAYDLVTNVLVQDREDGISVDSLFNIWKSATVAPDTLLVDSLAADTTESK